LPINVFLPLSRIFFYFLYSKPRSRLGSTEFTFEAIGTHNQNPPFLPGFHPSSCFFFFFFGTPRLCLSGHRSVPVLFWQTSSSTIFLGRVLGPISSVQFVRFFAGPKTFSFWCVPKHPLPHGRSGCENLLGKAIRSEVKLSLVFTSFSSPTPV